MKKMLDSGNFGLGGWRKRSKISCLTYPKVSSPRVTSSVRRPSHKITPLRTLVSVLLIAALIPQAVNDYSYALPTGADIQNGDVTFEQPDSLTLNITASHQSIINWQSFNIAQNEAVNFIQPLSSATVLNRVLGGGPSEIAGILSANGTVFLINDAGIVFSPTANVQVGGLIASSLNISNADFLAANYNFQKLEGIKAGQVINMGEITATRPGAVVALLGSVVENQGSIVAEVGSVAMASGDRVTMQFDEEGYIQVDVTDAIDPESLPEGTTTLPNAVHNTGSIKASGGKVVMSAEQVSGVFENLVNQEGFIEANSVEAAEGVITLKGTSGLVLNSGEIHAEGTLSNSQGGRVEVLGEQVRLEGGLINASGSTGGGTILIGGDYQGQGTLPTAFQTYVSSDTTIKADAVTSGNGGRVIIWSEYNTGFYGNVSAKGGAQSGEGGFTEVSSREYLDFRGMVNLTAPFGVTGTLLLDPNNLTISTGADASISQTGGDPNTISTTGNTAVLNTTTLNTALGLANVIIQTGTAAPSSQAGDLTISNTITAPANANSLSLLAHRHININANIDFTASSGNLTIRADGVSVDGTGAIVQGGGTIQMGTGDMRLTAGSGIGTSASPILTTGLTDVAATTGTGGIFIRNATSGNINITTVGGTTGLTTTTAPAAAGSNIVVEQQASPGTLTVSQAITTAGSTTASIPSGNVQLSTTNGNIIVNANVTTGNSSVADTGGGQISTSGSITLSSGTSVTGTARLITGNAVITGAAIGGGDTATSGSITVTAGTGGVSGGIGLSAANALTNGTAQRTGAGAGSDTATCGNISLTSRDEINNGTVSTAISITQGPASAAGTNNQGTLTLSTTTGAGNVFLSSSQAIRLAASSVAGNLDLTAAGAFTQTGALTVTGTSTFNAGANAITLTTATNNFTGAVSLNNSGANAVSIRDTNAIVLGTSSVGTSTLTVTAVGITQTGAITQAAGAGTATFTGGAGVITLTNAGNDFTGSVVLSNSGANAVSVTDTNAIAIETSGVGSGTLTVTTSGAITQTGAITQAAGAGTATFNAGANVITLTNAGNNFTGAVSVNNSGANNVSVTDTNAIILGTSAVGSGTLTITAGGNNTITQTGAIVQAAGAGAATFTTGNAAITLANAANDFTGSVSLTNGANNAVSVTDVNSIALGTVTMGGGSLNVTATGTITQTGTITNSGTATFAAGAANDITLAAAANNFGTVSVTSANNVTLVDTNAIDLGAMTLAGTLSVTAGGAMTDSGALVVTGTSTFAVGAANNITLNSAANDFSSVSITLGNNVTLVDVNALTLGALTAGSFNITSGGTMTVGTVTATAGAITLTTTGGGSILDGNGGANNLTASANSTLTAAGVIGSAADPLDVTITGATLTVGAGAAIGGVSIAINGTVTPSNTLNVPVMPPGQVLFNGVDIFAQPVVSSLLTINLFSLFTSLDEMNEFLEKMKDKQGVTADPFIDKRRWSLAKRPAIPTRA